MQLRESESQLRSIIRKFLLESLSDWNPDRLPGMFDAIFQKHAVLRNDPQVEPFSTRGGPMFLSFQALQKAARAADQIVSATSPDVVEPLRLEIVGELEKARDFILEILDAVGGRHKGIQELLGSMSELLGALDVSEDVYVPRADVGDLYEPL